MTVWQTLLPVLLLLIAPSTPSAHLITDGPRLRNATTGERIRLRCVNWYGAHQEPLVPGGLELASADSIAALIAQTGANCVRLPLADTTVLMDPPVEPRFLTPLRPGNATAPTALQVLDTVVEALTARGLLVILNSHTSWPGWVGFEGGGRPEEEPQGLWHTASIRTVDWVRALASLAKRYAANKRVVGLDLRNEIHDQDGVTLTWGESTNPDTDWRAAATLADRAIAAVNPHALIIVSGLCRAYDLRRMTDRPGPADALRRHKLVYTTHVYTFSWWWTHTDLRSACEIAGPVLLLSALLLLALFISGVIPEDDDTMPDYYYYATLDDDPDTSACLFVIPLSNKSAEHLTAAATAVLPFICLWTVIAYAKASEANAVGCSTIAAEATPWLIAGVALILLCAAAGCSGVTLTLRRLSAWFLAWTVLATAAVCILYGVSTTDWMISTELARWRLDGRSIPVWVGEFGTHVGDHSQNWDLLTKALRDKDLDFAYWAVNGRKWRHGAWEQENYGLLTDDYKAIRNRTFSDSIFRPTRSRTPRDKKDSHTH
jgi:hypothetical protein